MTIQEIEEFVQGELSDLNLSTSEKNNYITFIKKLDTHYQIHNINNVDARDVFIKKFEDCLEFLKLQGFDESTSLELTKKCIIEYDRKNFKEKLAFLRVINFEESIIMSDTLSLRFNLEKAHARKMYLININNKDAQTRNFIIHDGDSRVKKRFNIEMNELLKIYPLNKETINIWMTIAAMNDEKFKEYFKITREELSYIYPTTKDELATLHQIAILTNEEIIDKYGISRKELLQKYPLNNDTLKALKSIKLSSNKAIENTFNKSREEILNLRTITTEMIKTAQQEKISLKRNIYTKEELREQFKAKKKELSN